jgi:hypothetical protein
LSERFFLAEMTEARHRTFEISTLFSEWASTGQAYDTTALDDKMALFGNVIATELAVGAVFVAFAAAGAPIIAVSASAGVVIAVGTLALDYAISNALESWHISTTAQIADFSSSPKAITGFGTQSLAIT